MTGNHGHAAETCQGFGEIRCRTASWPTGEYAADVSSSEDLIVRTAARWIDRGSRLDTGALAAEVGVSRTTLFRRVGNREDLMGDALWLMSDRTIASVTHRWDKANGPAVRDPAGMLRCLWVMREYRAAIAGNKGMRVLLEEEPTVALRVLTDPHGRVQPRVIAQHVDLFARDVADGGFTPRVDLDTLAFAVVRLGEGFLYADVLADRTPDLEAATTLLGALVDTDRGL